MLALSHLIIRLRQTTRRICFGAKSRDENCEIGFRQDAQNARSSIKFLLAVFVRWCLRALSVRGMQNHRKTA